MPKYKVAVKPSAAKEIAALPAAILTRVLEAIQSLAADPRPVGCKKLHGPPGDLWRIRVGDYRIVYSVNDKALKVDVLSVRHRSQVYE